MSDDETPSVAVQNQVPSYDGRNKNGVGAKDKLEDSDHVASDMDINVQGDDQPHKRPGSQPNPEDSHPEDAPSEPEPEAEPEPDTE